MALFGLIAASIAIAYLTSQPVGWLVFGGVLVIDHYIYKFLANRNKQLDE